jgi:hypothetical protein
VIDKKMVNVRLSPVLWGRAKADAGRRGITLERWMAEAIEGHLDREASAPDGGAQSGQGLEWRVAALEEAVDYLASSIGAGLPGDRSGDRKPQTV